MDSTQLCRLCLETSDDLVNVSDSFEDSTIASILTQHFWFKVDKNDGTSEYVCEVCWTHTKAFHNFYKTVEGLHTRNSFDLSGSEEVSSHSALIKEEPPLELNFKCEEAELSDQIDTERIKEDSSSDSNDDSTCVQSNDAQTLADEYRPPTKKRKAVSVRDKAFTRSQTQSDCKSEEEHESHHNPKTHSKTRSEKEEEAAQIREFFNMKCAICNDVEFETLAQMRAHYRESHPNRSGYITCCGNRFYRRYAVLNHIVNHLHPDAFSCGQCDRRFKTGDSLKSHIANSHVPKSSRAFKCSLCTSSFVKAASLKYHVYYAHTSRNEGPFTCDICNKDYPSKFALSTHIGHVHERVPKYICDICAKEYKLKSSLANHMHEHSTTPRPKVQCNICGAWLKHELGLQIHVKRHQRTAVNCPICNKKVASKSALGSHKTHVHGDRRYPCTLCDKAFKTHKGLKEHMAVHTGEDLYSCSYCEKTFKSNANMYSHRKKAHLEEWTRDRQNLSNP